MAENKADARNAEEFGMKKQDSLPKVKVGLQSSKPLPKPAAVDANDDFSNLDISPGLQPIKATTKKAPDDYEIAMTGPAAFMDPPPKKLGNSGEEKNKEKSASVANFAASIEQVDETVVGKASAPRRNMVPVYAAVAASLGCFAFLYTYSWPSATASSGVDNGSSIYSASSSKPFEITVDDISDEQVRLGQPLGIASVEGESFDVPINIAGDEVSATVETHVAIALPTSTGSIRTDQASVTSKAEFVPLKSGISTASKNIEGLSRADCAARFNTVSLSGAINFESGSAILLRSSRPILHFFAAVFTHCRQFKVTIAGHTDSYGGAAFNQKLSEERAASVAEYLAQIGVPDQNLRVVGYGETKPIASNDTALKRGRNRRIEFMIGDG